MMIHAETLGAGPELVMVHGWGMHGGVWRDFAEQLAGFARVTLIDLPGHGLSALEGSFSRAAIGPELAQVVPRRAVWLGWSLGVLFALDQAERAPHRVSGTILVAGTPRFVADQDWPGMSLDRLDQFGRDLENDYVATATRFIALQTAGMDDARSAARLLARKIAERPSPQPVALRGGLAMLRHDDLRATLSDHAAPTLALLGERDRLVPIELERALPRLAPRAECQVLKGAAHLPFFTHRNDVVEAIRCFLAKIEP